MVLVLVIDALFPWFSFYSYFSLQLFKDLILLKYLFTLFYLQREFSIISSDIALELV